MSDSQSGSNNTSYSFNTTATFAAVPGSSGSDLSESGQKTQSGNGRPPATSPPGRGRSARGKQLDLWLYGAVRLDSNGRMAADQRHGHAQRRRFALGHGRLEQRQSVANFGRRQLHRGLQLPARRGSGRQPGHEQFRQRFVPDELSQCHAAALGQGVGSLVTLAGSPGRWTRCLGWPSMPVHATESPLGLGNLSDVSGTTADLASYKCTGRTHLRPGQRGAGRVRGRFLDCRYLWIKSRFGGRSERGERDDGEREPCRRADGGRRRLDAARMPPVPKPSNGTLLLPEQDTHAGANTQSRVLELSPKMVEDMRRFDLEHPEAPSDSEGPHGEGGLIEIPFPEDVEATRSRRIQQSAANGIGSGPKTILTHISGEPESLWHKRSRNFRQRKPKCSLAWQVSGKSPTCRWPRLMGCLKPSRRSARDCCCEVVSFSRDCRASTTARSWREGHYASCFLEGWREMQVVFAHLSLDQQLRLMERLTELPDSLVSWEITSLIYDYPKEDGLSISAVEGGMMPYATTPATTYTVTLNGRVYFAAQVNYLLYGELMELCHAKLQTQSGFEDITPQ